MNADNCELRPLPWPAAIPSPYTWRGTANNNLTPPRLTALLPSPQTARGNCASYFHNYFGQVLEKMRFIHERTGNNGMVVTFSFGGMPHEEAEKSMRLFASEVIPELKKIKVEPPQFARTA